MIRYEWKKLLFARRGLVVILLLLTLELIGTLAFTQPYDRDLEANREIYESYLSQVRGSLTPEKRDYLEAEVERLDAAHRDLEYLKQDYYQGAVTEEEYREKLDILAPLDEAYLGFSRVYSQYIFVRETDVRSFLYTGGWEVLLTEQEPDYLFLLALVILLTPIFCEEYACRMHEILLTQKKSARYQVGAKLLVALTLTAVLTAILEGFRLGYCALRFGLPDGGCSLQSLYSFADAQKGLNLWQGFWLQFALKEIGYLYAGIVILFLSVVLKKFATTLIMGIVLLPLPLLTVSDPKAFLRVPGPWALSVGSIYLNGGEGEVSWSELGILGLQVCLCVFLMLACIHWRNANWQLKKKPVRGTLLLCLMALTLTGCAGEKEETVFNYADCRRYETDAYAITSEFETSELLDKRTGERFAFPMTPMGSRSVTCGSTIFGTGDTVYYLKFTSHRPGTIRALVEQKRELVKLDLSNMKEETVYAWNDEQEWFFGLLDREDSKTGNFIAEMLFVHENGMYYYDSMAGSVNRMDLRTGKHEVILSRTNSPDLAFDGTGIYYLDEYNRLAWLEPGSGTVRTTDDVVANRFLLAPEGVYFLNRRDGDTLYLWDPETGVDVKLSDVPGLLIYRNESYVWILCGDGTHLRMRHDGSEAVTVDQVEYGEP